jgi:hypothetical protein
MAETRLVRWEAHAAGDEHRIAINMSERGYYA